MNQSTAPALPQSAQATRPLVSVLPTFDLTHVMARVARENPEWSQERLARAENDYRLFMARAKATPRTDHHNPSKDVDAVWHGHILHTREYAKDCSAYFGFFFHHAPFVGEVDLDSKMAMCSGNCGGRCD